MDQLINPENLPRSKYKAGFVAVVGRPNVGKSTLINSILSQKIAAVSPKPQTTRKQQLGIFSTQSAQIVFMDTPGIHIAKHGLGKSMNRSAEYAIHDGDLILWIVDGSVEPTKEDQIIAEKLNAYHSSGKTILVVNKSDLNPDGKNRINVDEYQELLPNAEKVNVSALQNQGIKKLLEMIEKRLPEGNPFFDDEQVTDYFERDIAVELIREAVLKNVSDEVPHAVAVRLDSYKDHGETNATITATLFVERESQKGILIGKQGSMIREIGKTAREEIELMTGRKIYLELHVKVHKNWRDNPNALNLFGYSSRKEK